MSCLVGLFECLEFVVAFTIWILIICLARPGWVVWMLVWLSFELNLFGFLVVALEFVAWVCYLGFVLWLRLVSIVAISLLAFCLWCFYYYFEFSCVFYCWFGLGLLLWF